jgi:hypothetical protein
MSRELTRKSRNTRLGPGSDARYLGYSLEECEILVDRTRTSHAQCCAQLEAPSLRDKRNRDGSTSPTTLASVGRQTIFSASTESPSQAAIVPSGQRVRKLWGFKGSLLLSLERVAEVFESKSACAVNWVLR